MTTSGGENNPRDGRGKFVRQIESAERDGEACRLYAQGWRIREIAEHLGYGSPGNAHRGIRRALAETANEHGARELRETQTVELDELRRRMWRVIQSPPPAYDRLGRIVRDDEGNPVPDTAAVTNAAGVIIRAEERLARLRGLDAPKRSVTVTSDMIQERMRELRKELGLPVDGSRDALHVLREMLGLPHDETGDLAADAGLRVLPGTVEDC